MKKCSLIILAIVTALSLISCAAKGHLKLKQPGLEIKGKTSPERAMDIYVDNAASQSLVLLYQQLAAAIEADDEGKIREVLKRIELVYGGGDSTTATLAPRRLHTKNISKKYIVEILSAPLTGVVLNPGEKTRFKAAFNVGVYPFTFNWWEKGTKNKGTKTVYVSIGRNRNTPIEIH